MDDITDSVEITFKHAGKAVAERKWNYLPEPGDTLDLELNEATVEYKVASRHFKDRKDRIISGLSRQKVEIELVSL